MTLGVHVARAKRSRLSRLFVERVAVTQAFVGRCQACGRCPECQHDGSALVNVLTVEGTLYGDTFCAECFDEEEAEGPVFFLPPLE